MPDPSVLREIPPPDRAEQRLFAEEGKSDLKPQSANGVSGSVLEASSDDSESMHLGRVAMSVLVEKPAKIPSKITLLLGRLLLALPRERALELVRSTVKNPGEAVDAPELRNNVRMPSPAKTAPVLPPYQPLLDGSDPTMVLMMHQIAQGALEPNVYPKLHRSSGSSIEISTAQQIPTESKPGPKKRAKLSKKPSIKAEQLPRSTSPNVAIRAAVEGTIPPPPPPPGHDVISATSFQLPLFDVKSLLQGLALNTNSSEVGAKTSNGPNPVLQPGVSGLVASSLAELALLTKPNKGCSSLRCEVCLKTFSSNSARKVHFDSVHRKIKFPCTVEGCGLFFPAKASRDRHSSNTRPDLHSPFLRRNTGLKKGRRVKSLPPAALSADSFADPLAAFAANPLAHFSHETLAALGANAWPFQGYQFSPEASNTLYGQFAAAPSQHWMPPQGITPDADESRTSNEPMNLSTKSVEALSSKMSTEAKAPHPIRFFASSDKENHGDSSGSRSPFASSESSGSAKQRICFGDETSDDEE